MVNNRVLTKFMEYRPEIFCYPRLKVTLPADFNDPFDSQLRLSENDTKKLSEKYNIPVDKVSYYAKRLQTVHILSLSRKHALDADSANMWGLYAKSGKGLAFEFDYSNVEEYNLLHLRQFCSQLKDAPNQVNYIKKKLTKRILAQIKATCSAENRYSGANEIISHAAPICLIPDFIAGNEELTCFESMLSGLTISEVKKQAHLLDKLLKFKMINSLRSLGKFLHPVIYNKQRGILSIFEDFIAKLENNQSTLALDLVSEFMITKTQIWKHEKESRFLVMDVCSNIINKSNSLLSELRANSQRYIIADEELEQVRAELHFINFSKVIKVDPIELSHQSSGEDIGFIPKVYLPFPTKIYLGWDFDIESANGKEQLKHIKEYARKYKIELWKLNKEIDYTSEKRAVFMADEIKI